jgi:hypothetical protein
MRYFVRLGYDERNYYMNIPGGIMRPDRPPAHAVAVDHGLLTDFTDLKLSEPTSATIPPTRAVRRRHAHVHIQQFAVGRTREGAADSTVPQDSAPTGRRGRCGSTTSAPPSRSLDGPATGSLCSQVADLFNFTTNWDRTDGPSSWQRGGAM